MNILMTYHGNFDPNSGAAGIMVKIGNNLEKLGLKIDYYTYSNLPSSWHHQFSHFIFPFFVHNYINNNPNKWQIIDCCTGDNWIFGTFKNLASKPKIILRSSGLEHMWYESLINAGENFSWKGKLIWGNVNLKLVEISLKTADHILAVNNTEKDFLINQLLIPKSKITILYRALPDYFLNLPKHQINSEFKILYVSTWLNRKGVKYLVEALEKLMITNIIFSVTLVGVKIEENIIRNQLSPQLNSRVTIIDSLPNCELPKVYQNHSVFVFPSLYEGFPNVITEAMATGLPIITTTAGAAKELIIDKHNGMIIPYQDSEAIYQTLIYAYHNPNILQNYGDNAQKFINELNINEVYQKRLEIYKSLL